MSLVNTILQAASGPAVNMIAEKFGLSGQQASSVIAQLVPALTAGVKNNTASQEGLENLVTALGKGKHSQFIEQPQQLDNQGAIQDGNKILGHLFGSKEVSRAVANQASGSTGIDSNIIKQMLPMVANLAMGAMATQTQKSASSPNNLLSSLLDADKDGSVADDIMGLVGKMFR